jgi:hypothetical protein
MEDSSLVIDGLLDSGWNHDALRSCVDLLIKTFYAPDDGAFHTLFQGRSKYWLGPSLEANAFAVYFIERLAPSSYSTIKEGALKYILSYPLAPTGWKGRWFQQQALSNYYVLRALAAVGREFPDLISILTHLLLNQSADGCWNKSVISTSLNALSIAYLIDLLPASACEPLDPQKAILKAESWLKNIERPAICGEPIIYYWYEIESPILGVGARKVFYHCEDMGEIGNAWLHFSLREIGLYLSRTR